MKWSMIADTKREQDEWIKATNQVKSSISSRYPLQLPQRINLRILYFETMYAYIF